MLRKGPLLFTIRKLFVFRAKGRSLLGLFSDEALVQGEEDH